MDNKHCSRCGLDKPLQDFNKNKAQRSGFQRFCRECQRAVKHVYLSKFESRLLEWHTRRRWYYERGGKEIVRRNVKAFLKRSGYSAWHDPLKARAWNITKNEIRQGRLVRQPCEQCGNSEKIHAHHDDYTKPLEIRWLCAPCHHRHHHPLPTKERSQ